MPILDIIKEPQKTYNWEVEIFPRRYLSPAGLELKYYAKTVNIPSELVETAKRYYAGKKYHVPLKDTSPSIINVSFWDNKDLSVYLFFKRLHDLINKTNVESPIFGGGADIGNLVNTGNSVFGTTPADYLFDMNVTMTTNFGNAATTFVYKDCHINEIGDIPLNYEESSEITFDVRIQYDSSEIYAGGLL